MSTACIVSLMIYCTASLLGESCYLPADHATEHESESYIWDMLPPIPGRRDQSNPFERPR
jgi:hypothetical protein